MSKTYQKIGNREEMEANFELDLSPMLALMVSLIPIMLLSTVFVKVTVIETPLPQVVKQAIENDRKKKERNVEVSVKLAPDKKIFVLVSVDGKQTFKRQIVKDSQKWSLTELNTALVQVKKSHPKIFRLSLIPHESVSYEEIVKVIDEVRTVRNKNTKLFVKDEKTNQLVETDVMFPDVVFANVIEG